MCVCFNVTVNYRLYMSSVCVSILQLSNNCRYSICVYSIHDIILSRPSVLFLSSQHNCMDSSMMIYIHCCLILLSLLLLSSLLFVFQFQSCWCRPPSRRPHSSLAAALDRQYPLSCFRNRNNQFLHLQKSDHHDNMQLTAIFFH